MKKEAVKFFAVVVMFFCLVLPANAGNFKNVVVFGDSLSDSGNVYSKSGETYPPAPYQGRFSDGPVWVEYLVKTMGISGDFGNYAFAGANTTGLNNPAEGNAPGFKTQVAAYTSLLTASAFFPTSFPQPKETLFIIWIGANDFLDMTDPTAASAVVMKAVANIRTGLTQLADTGAVMFMVVNLPDLGITPRMNQDATLSAGGTQLAAAFNSALEGVLQDFETAHPGIEVVRLDSFTLLQEIVADPETWGFANVTDAKFDKVHGTVAEGSYLFWDDIHPTTRTHQLLAYQAAALLEGDYTGQPRIGAALKLTIPYAELDINAYGLGNNAYGLSLDYCADPAADPDGYYWKLDPLSITVE